MVRLAMVRLMTGVRRFAGDERGVAMVLFALMALILVPVAGGALDYSGALTARARVAAAADAAALAISTRSETDPATAKKLAAALLAAQYPASERNGARIDGLAVDLSVRDRVEVRIRGSMPALFLTVIGMAELPINARAVASRSSGQNIDVVMVLDNTGSMGEPASSVWRSPFYHNSTYDHDSTFSDGTKLEALKAAAKKVPELLLSNKKGDSLVQIGLVPFSESVNVGAHRKDAWLNLSKAAPPETRPALSWNGCVTARRYPHDVRDTDHVEGGKWKPLKAKAECVRASILPLTQKKADINRGIEEMFAEGATAIPLGLAWGWRALSPKQPFVEAQPDVDGQPTVRRAIILLTDGENTWSRAYGQSMNGDDLDRRTRELCKNIKEAGIQLYTINFEVDDKDKQLMKDCASQTACSGKRCNFDGTSATIGRIFKEIANDLARTRLTY